MINTGLAHAVVFLTLCLAYLLWGGGTVGWVYLQLSGLACFLYVSFQLATYVDNVLPRFRVTATRKAVFITGCDRGFGRLLARRLDSIGFKVFAGCLDPDSKDVEQLKDTVSNHLVILPIDVTSDESVDNALKAVKDGIGDCEFWALVNNAGVIERGELEWTPMEQYQKQFDVNTFGVIRVTQKFLPLIRKSKGRVVTVTSIGGRMAFSGFVPYCMSKHAVTAFCDGLRLEMKKFGVKVITIEPFSYKTCMTEIDNMMRSIRKAWDQTFSTRENDDVYDEKYFKAFSDSVRSFNDATLLSNVDHVVDLMVEGVCATNPHYSYVPGDICCHLNLWFSRRAPKTIVDHFVRQRVTFDMDVENFLNERRKKT